MSKSDKLKPAAIGEPIETRMKREHIITTESCWHMMKEAFKNLKRRYFINILVVYVVALFISGGYQFATKSVQEARHDIQTNTRRSNTEILEEFVSNLFQFDFVKDPDAVPTTSEKYSRGFASVFVNQITGSQSYVFGIVNGINEAFFKGQIANSVIIFIFATISSLIFIFVKNVIVVGRCRYFLEQRRYEETKPGEILFPYKNKRLKNVAFVMMMRYIFQALWNLTIVGGIIKYYQYKMIPWILAENPYTPMRDCFRISREMIKGEKWRTFLISLILFPLKFLSSATYRLTGVFFSEPFVEVFYAEYYMHLRHERYAEFSVKDRALLNDYFLDITELQPFEHPSGDEFFDIKLPGVKSLKHDYARNYSIVSLIQLFFTYAFVGWCWEVFLYLAQDGVFVNRGTMHGPWLPIYGVGGLLIMILLKPLREHPGKLLLGSVFICGMVEYWTAWGLETFAHKKWWDYSGYYLNLHGRICLEGLLVFGLAGMAFTYIFSPWLDDFYQHMKMKNRKIICTVLLIFFAGDAVWSLITPNTGEGITSKIQPANEVCRENGEQYKYIASEGRIKLEDSIKLKNSI